MTVLDGDVMRQATFVLPVRVESIDRLSNLITVVNFLRRNHSSRIIVGSEDAAPFRAALPADVEVVELIGPMHLPFHHARALNDVARHVTTSVTVKIEADVIIPPAQMHAAVRMAGSGEHDLVLPYRTAYTIQRHERLRFAEVEEYDSFVSEDRQVPFEPLGYCAVWNTEAYRRGGMENEHFISWGLDDNERLLRAERLGLRHTQVDGPVFHLHHDRFADSLDTTPYYKGNEREYHRIRELDADQLRAEIASWPWLRGSTSTTIDQVAADDLTIVVPVRLELPDRLNNLLACLRAAAPATTTRILVGIGDPSLLDEFLPDGVDVVALHDPPGPFHHTRLNNDLVKLADTPLVAILDADIVVPAAQWRAALEAARAGADLVLPYAAEVRGVPYESHAWLERGDLASMPPGGQRVMHPHAVGGCVLVRRASHLAAGLDNEHIVSWGFEDDERIARAKVLGLRVERCAGTLFHLDHDRTPHSDDRNPAYAANREEYERIRDLTDAKLRAEIATWPWLEGTC